VKIRTRILLASGFYRFGGTISLLLLTYYVQPLFLVPSIVWLTSSRRIIRERLLPPLFSFAMCGHCHRRLPLRCRWRCTADAWTDSRVRHALAVYSDQGHEVRSFDCIFCESTISLQKGDRDLYKRWRPMEGSVAAVSTKPSQFGLRFGFDRSFTPGVFGKLWRRLRRRPIADPVIVSHEVLGRHGTVFGATGMGKSTLILSLAQQVFQWGDGATFLDPAGDLSRDLLRQVPINRIDDVLYIDVGDQRFPFPFNILQAGDANERNLLVDEVLGIFKNIYQRSWGDTLSHQLRMALNAALEIGGSFADVYNLFTRPEVRQRIVRRIKNKELRQYWEDTFPSSSLATRMSIINKLAPIVEHPFLGPILCSRQCAFNADDVIRKRKILIVNLATGTRADYTTEILGTFVVNKLVTAAYRQGNIEDRAKRVRHFFFVDEFQNFMHRASGWDRSLSELRKFNLCLILVTQFVEQVKDDIRAAIFGNVGFLVSFRVGHRDSKILKDEFGGTTSQSLLELERGECFIRVGTYTMAVRTELPPTLGADPAPQIIERMHRLVTELRESEPRIDGAEKVVIDMADGEDDSDSGDPPVVETVGPLVLCEFA
jgi:hypothetical protein